MCLYHVRRSPQIRISEWGWAAKLVVATCINRTEITKDKQARLPPEQRSWMKCEVYYGRRLNGLLRSCYPFYCLALKVIAKADRSSNFDPIAIPCFHLGYDRRLTAQLRSP